MSRLGFLLKPLTVGLLLLTLAACDSAEERAEAYYQSGLALLEEGDVDRALVELRNVFEHNGQHREARMLYARLVREQGKEQEAYGQYLRLVEQYPDDYEGRLALSEMAFIGGNLEEFRRHAAALNDLPDAADAADAQAIAIGLQYQSAVIDEDAPARRDAVRAAQLLTASASDNEILPRVLIDGYIRDQELDRALTIIDQVIADADTPDKTFEQLRLQTLSQLNDGDGVEAQLRRMVDLFPDDPTIPSTLLRYYAGQGKLDAAEAFLRETSDPTAEDIIPYASYIGFLRQTRGLDAAVEELERGIAAAPDQIRLKALRAGFDFEQGRVDEAIGELNAILDSAEPNEDSRTIRVALAQILIGTGDEVGARQQVEQVLEADPSQVAALRMQAAWMIEADNTDGAIGALRTALDQDPNDAIAMTLMAQAHTRAGNHELAQDFLSLAVEASGNAPAESLRFASALTAKESYRAAEEILITSLRLNPANESILLQLGRIYLAEEDRPRTEQVIATLRRLETDSARSMANNLEAARLSSSMADLSATVQFLEQIVQSGEGDEAAAARINIIRARLVSGEIEEALAYARAQLQERPDDVPLRLTYATVLQVNRDFKEAAVQLRNLVDESPDAPSLRLQLIRVLRADGEIDAANTVLEEGLERTPEAPNLLWAKASDLERVGDIGGAIAIYEQMYARNSSLPVIANNLASLLATWRDDDESLAKARTISQRFRGTNVPAFQDTYGWIAYRNNDFDEALEYLEPAAEGLPRDAVTQYHLGMTYLALERPQNALEQFRRAVDIAGSVDTRPQIEDTRAKIVLLSAQADAEPEIDPSNP